MFCVELYAKYVGIFYVNFLENAFFFFVFSYVVGRIAALTKTHDWALCNIIIIFVFLRIFRNLFNYIKKLLNDKCIHSKNNVNHLHFLRFSLPIKL